jgi:hypothetical protein
MSYLLGVRAHRLEVEQRVVKDEGTQQMHRKLGRTVAAAVTATIAAAAFASPAHAGLLTASAETCDDGPITQPFQRFNDWANYKLLPGGSFEAGTAAWQLSGGAKIVSGNETYKVGGATHSRSLSLPQGGAAISPFTCVGLSEPTLRLFAKRNSALLGLVSTLSVQIQVKTSLGLSLWLPVLPGDLGGGSWHPTVPMPLIANILPLSHSDKTPVRFRFAPLLGSWQIDDVYVDPYRNR